MTTERPSSRRAVLRGLGTGVGGAVGVEGLTGGVGAETAGETATAEASVMTRNLALGADLSRLYGAEVADVTGPADVADLGEAASDAATAAGDLADLTGDLVAAAEASAFPRRAAAIAGEIARTRPALVGVQEAIRVTVDAQVLLHYLRTLREALDDRGLDYRVAARRRNVDVTLPATVDDSLSMLTVVDQDAVLVRDDVSTGNARTGEFDATLEVGHGGRGVTVPRGWAAVDVPLGDGAITFVTTHLEAVEAGVRRAQARELTETFGDAGSVVVAGDFNDGDDGGEAGSTYELLTETFEDASTYVGGSTPTCCQSPDLRNRRSKLYARPDNVLFRGPLTPTAVSRTGETEGARVDTPNGTVWPSDHAGVVAAMRADSGGVNGTTASPRPAPTDEGVDVASTSTSAPGFRAVAALAALGTAIGAALRRRE